MFSSKRKRYQTYHYIKQSVGSTLEYLRISIMLAACYLSSLRSFLISDNITESILIEPFSQSMVLFCRVKRQFNIASNTDKSISYKKNKHRLPPRCRHEPLQSFEVHGGKSWTTSLTRLQATRWSHRALDEICGVQQLQISSVDEKTFPKMYQDSKFRCKRANYIWGNLPSFMIEKEHTTSCLVPVY